MKIEITPARAQEIKYMFEDWAEIFSTNRKQFKDGYIASAKDFMDIFDITMDDIEEVLKWKDAGTKKISSC